MLTQRRYYYKTSITRAFYLLSALPLGRGSSTGCIAEGVFIPTLEGCTTAGCRIGRPADVERTE